jgi:hypothetical protein
VRGWDGRLCGWSRGVAREGELAVAGLGEGEMWGCLVQWGSGHVVGLFPGFERSVAIARDLSATWDGAAAAAARA